MGARFVKKLDACNFVSIPATGRKMHQKVDEIYPLSERYTFI